MDAESMVHALEQIHNLLVPGGHLIDIHPSGEPAEFIYPLDGQEHFIGYMQETDDYIEYRQASEAIETALSKGLFQVEKFDDFTFYTYADSFDALRAYLEENWSDAILDDEVVAGASAFEKEYGELKVTLREKIKIGLLKRE